MNYVITHLNYLELLNLLEKHYIIIKIKMTVIYTKLNWKSHISRKLQEGCEDTDVA
jgi:hypothetical protein